MTSQKRVWAGLTVVMATVWLLGAPSTAYAFLKEKEPIDGAGSCPGIDKVGKAIIINPAKGGVKVKVRIKNGQPNQTLNLIWVGISTARSCDQADVVGEKFLAQFTLSPTGEGGFSIWLSKGSPFPGSFVRLRLDGGTYHALFDNVFQ